jgi:hypothetical protein
MQQSEMARNRMTLHNLLLQFVNGFTDHQQIKNTQKPKCSLEKVIYEQF